jgi:hypothetical protein
LRLRRNDNASEHSLINTDTNQTCKSMPWMTAKSLSFPEANTYRIDIDNARRPEQAGQDQFFPGAPGTPSVSVIRAR